MQKYDLIIVGGVAGGFAAANTANRLKKESFPARHKSTLMARVLTQWQKK